MTLLPLLVKQDCGFSSTITNALFQSQRMTSKKVLLGERSALDGLNGRSSFEFFACLTVVVVSCRQILLDKGVQLVDASQTSHFGQLQSENEVRTCFRGWWWSVQVLLEASCPLRPWSNSSPLCSALLLLLLPSQLSPLMRLLSLPLPASPALHVLVH